MRAAIAVRRDPDQISLYREARAAIDRSIDMTARADMMRTLGDEYAAMRDAVLEQPSLDSAAQLLLDMLEQDAKAVPDNRDRLAVQMQQIRKRLEDAKALQESGYAPLSRFGRYTVDVVDAAGERQYFGMYETMRRRTLPRATSADLPRRHGGAGNHEPAGLQAVRRGDSGEPGAVRQHAGPGLRRQRGPGQGIPGVSEAHQEQPQRAQADDSPQGHGRLF
jgi:hypothetical protein